MPGVRGYLIDRFPGTLAKLYSLLLKYFDWPVGLVVGDPDC